MDSNSGPKRENSSMVRRPVAATLGAELFNAHNHVRPETADAAVMVKAASKKLSQRPISATEQTSSTYQKSVEEELELTSRISSKATNDHQPKGKHKVIKLRTIALSIVSCSLGTPSFQACLVLVITDQLSNLTCHAQIRKALEKISCVLLAYERLRGCF